MFNCKNLVSFGRFPNSGILRAISLAGFVLLAAVSTVTALPIISITNESLTLGSNGVLSYTVTHELETCSGPPESTFQLWSYTKFVFTDQFGEQHSLGGTADYIISTGNAEICASSGSFGVTLSGNGYTIAFTPTANGGASATFQFQPGYVDLRWVVVGVTYAPPGPSANTFVQYSKSNLVGTTQTVSNSFLSSVSQSVSLSESSSIVGVLDGKVTATFDSSNTMSTKDSKSVTLSLQVLDGEKTPGTANYFAPVNHDYDIVWVWLNPVALFSIVDGAVVWNGYGFNEADQPSMDIVPIQLGYLNGDLGAIPSDIATSLARSWAASEVFPPGQGPGLTSADLAQIAAADPFSVSTYGTSELGSTLPSQTQDTRFTLSECDSSSSFNYLQAAPSTTAVVETCTITYTTATTNATDITSTYTQTFSLDTSLSGSLFGLTLSGDLKTSNTLTFTTEQQNSITSGTTNTASLSIQGPPCNNVTAGVGPCVPVYDSAGNQPVQFEVYQDNKYGTFMFAPVHYY
jgi:hypothetical protein